jgi:hypothetical protein
MRRNDQPSRPKAMTCSRFSLLKAWLMTTEANFPLRWLCLKLSLYGRFWVITEATHPSITFSGQRSALRMISLREKKLSHNRGPALPAILRLRAFSTCDPRPMGARTRMMD